MEYNIDVVGLNVKKKKKKKTAGSRANRTEIWDSNILVTNIWDLLTF